MRPGPRPGLDCGRRDLRGPRLEDHGVGALAADPGADPFGIEGEAGAFVEERLHGPGAAELVVPSDAAAPAVVHAGVPVARHGEPDPPESRRDQAAAGEEHVIEMVGGDRVEARCDHGRGDGDDRVRFPVEEPAEIGGLLPGQQDDALDAAAGEYAAKPRGQGVVAGENEVEGVAERFGARAQGTYPNRVIRIIVPAGPGGPTDVFARLVAQRMSATLGKDVIIENRAGAGGAIAAKMVSTAPADGYTLFLANTSTNAIIPAFAKIPDYDPEKQFAAIAIMASSFHTMVVRSDSPVKSVKEFIELARTSPKKLDFGSAGHGNLTHLAERC